MFTTFNEAVDQSTKYAKAFVAFVQDKKVRDEISTLIDAQSDYTKSTYKTAQSLGQVFVDSFGKYSIPKSFN